MNSSPSRVSPGIPGSGTNPALFVHLSRVANNEPLASLRCLGALPSVFSVLKPFSSPPARNPALDLQLSAIQFLFSSLHALAPLFALFARHQSFIFNDLQTLFAKQGGGTPSIAWTLGRPRPPQTFRRVRSYRVQAFLSQPSRPPLLPVQSIYRFPHIQEKGRSMPVQPLRPHRRPAPEP